MAKEMTPGSFSNMASSWCNRKISSVISVFVCFLLVVSSKICPVSSSETGSRMTNQTFRPQEELQKLKIIREHLEKINKPASPVGDLIDCVLSHQQPAFDHPQLKGQKPLEPPERPKGLDPAGMATENFQLWGLSGEACPEGTVPIRRTTEQDMLRASSIRRFGRKLRRHVRRDTNSNGHEHAVGYVTGEQYYGAKASINVWAPRVSSQYEFSLSQMWVISGSFGDDLNTIEAGWQDPKHGNWWLEFGNGVLVGYWPSFLFTHLRDHASMVQFGGEIVNSMPSGFHTSTQMGSGHFAGEGFGKASYFRNLQVVDWDNNLLPLSNLRVLADHPNCYDIQGGINRVWGNYFYYGGPGRNVRCP
uniref:Neprosin PEP catalytic domain-containing protein n=1 Tax=Salix viminalis TaxID=40686 RepID=A0A6N2K6H2_SALVM